MLEGFNLESQAISLEPQAISIDVLLERYARGEEKSITDVKRRIARSLASIEKDTAYWEEQFFQNLLDGFIPSGHITSAVGTKLVSTLIDCFVQPVGDCIEGVDHDGYPSIYTALAEAAATMRLGGEVSYDFSHIRPAGASIKGTQLRASGPLPYMRVFDASYETIESAGISCGIQMGVLRCDHPDIFDFVVAKQVKDQFNNFNLSIGITDKFMQAVRNKELWELVHKTTPNDEYIRKNNSYFDEKRNLWVWKVVPAEELWELIMQSAYNYSEPSVLFLDQINAENNLYYCEKIEAINSCGEQPLPNYACCNSGFVNLTAFVHDPFTYKAWFDWEKFEKVVRLSVRMLDNVLNVTIWPLPQQQQEAMKKRRIGLGFLGLGDAIIMLNKHYNKPDGIEFARQVSEHMRNTAYNASIDLAIEKGTFPMFDAEKYLEGQFISRLPRWIRKRISHYGIRNSHLLSIAPSEIVSLTFADNASSGIEPSSSWVYSYKKRTVNGELKEFDVMNYAYRIYKAISYNTTKLPNNFITALEMTVYDHVNMVKTVQPYIDGSISKTVNILKDYPYENFKNSIYGRLGV